MITLYKMMVLPYTQTDVTIVNKRIMPNTCQMLGKKDGKGNRRSHSNIATGRRFKVNLQKKRLVNPATGETMTLHLSTKALKTLKKWKAEGKTYDLRALVN